MDEQKQFPETESALGEEAVRIVEMATQHLEYYVRFIEKLWQGLRGLTPALEEVLLWFQCY